MSDFDATFTGSVVADPKYGTTPNGASYVQFPVYVNHSRKPKGSEQYVKTGDVSKVRVTLWGDLSAFDVAQGDLVKVTAAIVEKEFETRDGGKGRQLQTDWVQAIETKYRKDGLNAPAASVTHNPEVVSESDDWATVAIENGDTPF